MFGKRVEKKIGIALALRSFHCNTTLNKQTKKISPAFCLPFSQLASFFQPWPPQGSKKALDKSKLLLLNHSKMKAVSALNEMLLKNALCHRWYIYTCFATFPGNSTSTQNLPAGTTLSESAEPPDWDTARSPRLTLCSCLSFYF